MVAASLVFRFHLRFTRKHVSGSSKGGGFSKHLPEGEGDRMQRAFPLSHGIFRLDLSPALHDSPRRLSSLLPGFWSSAAGPAGLWFQELRGSKHLDPPSAPVRAAQRRPTAKALSDPHVTLTCLCLQYRHNLFCAFCIGAGGPNINAWRPHLFRSV